MKNITKLSIVFGAIFICLFAVSAAQASTSKTITGQVLKSDGTAVTNAMIVPSRTDSGDMTGVSSGNTDASGNYSLSLPAADWSLTVRPQTFATDWGYFGSPQIVVFNHDESLESKTQNFTVTKTDAVIAGTLLYSDGNTAHGSQVSAVNSEGKGVTVQAGAGGVFSIPVVAGAYSVEIGWHPEMSTQAFSRQTVTVTSGETKDVGTITASLMDSHITGTVSGVSPGFGQGMTIRAWQKDGNVTLNTDTDANKSFDFTVSPGTWLLGPGGGGQSHHFFVRSPIEVTIDSHGQTVNVDFPYVAGDYFVAGSITDENGAPVDLTGIGTIYVRDERGQTFTNFVEGSQYQIIYPSDYMTENIKVGLEILPNAQVGGFTYSFKEEKDLVMTSDHGDANLVVKKDEETISGQLRDANGNVITNLPTPIRIVGADSNGNVKTSDVKSDGTYSMSVADGAWRLGVKILDESTNYYILNPDNEATVADKSTSTLDVAVAQTDSTITGQVLDKDGNTVARTAVLAKAGDLSFKTETDDSGNFSLGVKSGLSYSLTMGMPSSLSGNLPFITHTSAGGVATLRMQGTDAIISGKMYLGNSAVSQGYVKAWADDGAFAKADVASDGSYSLVVVSGKKWYLAGASINETKAYVSEIIELTPSATNTLNISLGENYYNFPPVTIEKFYANDSKVFALKDGTVIQLPAYATGTSGSGSQERTLMAIPTIDLASQTNSQTLPIGYNFEIRDENNVKITNFNQPVLVIFAWNPKITDEMGADTASLEPKYWDSGNSLWRGMGMNIKNSTNNTNVIVTDHFTSFGLASASLGNVKKAQNYIVATPAKNNSSLIKIYNAAGKKFKQFYAFKKKQKGNFKSQTADFNGDTVSEVLVYSGEKTKLGMQLFTKNGTKFLTKNLYPFGKKYNKDYIVATSDFNADGKAELIAANYGKNSQIKIYKYGAKKFSLWKTIKPYGAAAENVNVISADIAKKHPGKELIVSSKNQRQVKAYYFAGKKFKMLKKFSPYNKAGGINLAAGDVNNDGIDELVVSPKAGALKGKAKVYKFTNKFVLLNSFYKDVFGYGANVNLADVNADGKTEMIVSPEIGNLISVKVYKLVGAKKIKLIKSFAPFKTGLINIRAADLNRDGKAEIVVAQKSGNLVKVYRYASKKFSVLKKLKPFGKKYSKGINFSLLKY
ncbi:MAG: hypothetical protein AB1465_04450 [Patescibacteria group bacterium]